MFMIYLFVYRLGDTYKTTYQFSSGLVELDSLVVQAADGRRVGQVPPVAHVPQGDTAAGNTGTGRLRAAARVPRVANVHPGEPDPLLLLAYAGRGPC